MNTIIDSFMPKNIAKEKHPANFPGGSGRAWLKKKSSCSQTIVGF